MKNFFAFPKIKLILISILHCNVNLFHFLCISDEHLFTNFCMKTVFCTFTKHYGFVNCYKIVARKVSNVEWQLRAEESSFISKLCHLLIFWQCHLPRSPTKVSFASFVWVESEVVLNPHPSSLLVNQPTTVSSYQH